jgi:hypothetical protein
MSYFFQAFQQRASQAVSAARDLATTVGADVYDNVKVTVRDHPSSLKL